jgi:hypothetical protein
VIRTIGETGAFPWGAMRSDQATVRIRYRRIGDYLRTTVIIYDPVYFDARTSGRTCSG